MAAQRKGDTNCSRLESVEFLVTKRLKAFEYTKGCLGGVMPWLDCVLLSPDDVRAYCHGSDGTVEKRARRWFYLGLSLAPLIDLPNGLPYLQALATLFEEWDYCFSTAVMQSWKWAVAKVGSIVAGADTTRHPTAAADTVGARLPQHLLLPPLATRLDYFEVVHTLLDLLALVYLKFTDESSATPAAFGAVLHADRLFQDSVLDPLSRDLNAIARQVTTRQVRQLDGLFADLRLSRPQGEDDWLDVSLPLP
eukprot:GGOE01041279.1.p1 GENE.GGOE01041279.1~~GGOE01041279.1.p1  ORF type:complete len:251 (+),score=77.01 GGOE01041279.1:87-839(+)